MKNIGLKDIPLQNKGEESLGLAEYADALTDFILQCETPMTIALQGDWGSGKTSLMNLIKNELEQHNNNIKTVWFNTWQFSQFQMGNNLAISFVTHLVDEIEPASTVTTIFRNIGRATKAALVATSAAAGHGEAGQAFADNIASSDADDPAKAIKSLKNNLEKMLNEYRSKGTSRIVIFIDDLDRLVPERAVELLEVLKLFLDIDGCVFVLACDYQVVSKGLKNKFGVGSEDLSGKSFFDKIIQLPFSMPVTQYTANDYIKRLLGNIAVNCEESDVSIYHNLVAYSCGFNPRSLKRLFNSLLLLNLVADKKKLYDSMKDNVQKHEMQRALFGVLCMQTAYEPMYVYLQKSKDYITEEMLSSMRTVDGIVANKNLIDFLKNSNADGEETIRQLSEFMKSLFNAMQIKSDNDNSRVSSEEINALKQLLSFSSLTSTSNAIQSDVPDSKARAANRSFIDDAIEFINKKYKKDLKKCSIDGLSRYQGRGKTEAVAYINLDKLDKSGKVEINFGYDTEIIHFRTYVHRNSDIAQSIEYAKNTFNEFSDYFAENDDSITFYEKRYSADEFESKNEDFIKSMTKIIEMILSDANSGE